MNLVLPKISVITVSYNHDEFIRQTIESVLLQNYPNFEHIVVDGGSNDKTIEILKSYPHLRWSSEPDRGQSHALNKGFKLATGDIIAWLNSDDWYHPKIFHEVAKNLEQHPILMGACELTDRYGERKELVPNVERNWFDILKYWIFYSSPSQPSIFFRKDLLEKVRLPNGDYLDESLQFCMDYDLWLRMTEHAELNNRLNKTFSYYRTYDTNKTGAHMDATYREMSEVFKRHSIRKSKASRSFTLLLATDHVIENLDTFVQQLKNQSQNDIELLFINYAKDPKISRDIWRSYLNIGAQANPIGMRYIRSDAETKLSAVMQGIEQSCAPFVAYLPLDAKLSGDFFLNCQKIFQHDHLALLLPKELQAGEIDAPKLPNALAIEAIFNWSKALPYFVGRKVALLENQVLSEDINNISPLLTFRALMLNLCYSGWRIFEGQSVSSSSQRACCNFDPYLMAFAPFINAHIILDCHKRYTKSKFAQLRGKHGFSVVFPDNIIAQQKQIMQVVPAAWFNTKSHNSTLELDQMLTSFNLSSQQQHIS